MHPAYCVKPPIKQFNSFDGGEELVQEQKLRKRLAQLQKYTDVGHHGKQVGCRGQAMLDEARKLLHDLEGYKRWGRFQRGMLDRASAAAVRQSDVPVVDTATDHTK